MRRPPARPSLACAGLLGALTAAACVSPGTPGRAQSGIRTLPAVEGATAVGRLEPGESALYRISLEAGEYLEVHVDRPPEEVRVYLFAPDVDPWAPGHRAYTFGERSTEVPGGQAIWEVLSASAVHHLRVEAARGSPVAFELTVRALRPATPRDWSRHRGSELWNQAEQLRFAGRLHEALEHFDQAFELCEEGGYRVGMAASYSRRVRILLAFGRLDEAREQLLAALEIWRELGDEGSVAGTYVVLAGVDRQVARWETMHEYLETGLAMARRLGNRGVEANALLISCKYLMDQGRTDEALATCRRSLELWEGQGQPIEGADVLTNLGYIAYYQGDLEEARAQYHRGLELVERHPDPLFKATLQNNLALLHGAAGEYQTALVFYQEAFEAYDSLGRTGFAAKVLQNMGRIHQRLGDPAIAGEFYRQALVGMELAEDVLGWIGVLHHLGDLHAEQGDVAEARRFLDRALALSGRAESRVLLAGTLSRIANIHLEEGEPARALVSLEEALALSRASAHRREEARALALLSEAHARLGDSERALAELFQAAALNEELGNRAALAENHYRIARLERERSGPDAARRAVERALAVVETVRPAVGGDELRALYSATARPYHELYIELLMDQHRRRPDAGHVAEAFRQSERARARGLLEILAEAALDPGSEVPEELLEERTRLQRRLNARETERQGLLAREDSDPAALFRVKLDLEALLTRLREVERRIRTESPRYAALTRPRSVTVSEIQRSILDRETSLLEYSLGEERSFLWVVTAEELHSYELPGRAVIEAAARCVHWLITAYGAPPPADALAPEEAACLGDRLGAYAEAGAGRSPLRTRSHRRRAIAAAFEQAAGELSHLVLGPPAADGLLAYRLAVVSDGALEYVPFAALPSPGAGGRPLVMDHELVRLPSASVLAFQRGRPVSAPGAAGLLAVVADPVYHPEDPRVAGRRSQGASRVESAAVDSERGALDRFSRLDFSGREADAIVRFARSRGTFEARGLEASRETVLGGALSGFRYVHFATHGVIDTRYPQFSALVLSLVDSAGASQENGFLRLHDIYGLRLDGTDMVVLSACDTALGREIRGEGLVGLTRGFLYAGAERVVASLWPVQDLATARLMERFYRGLLEEDLPPAQALRRAQLALLEEPDGASDFPYYWAGFVLQGEWR